MCVCVVLPPSEARVEQGRRERARALCRGTSLIRRHHPLGPYSRPVPRALCGHAHSQGGLAVPCPPARVFALSLTHAHTHTPNHPPTRALSLSRETFLRLAR